MSKIITAAVIAAAAAGAAGGTFVGFALGSRFAKAPKEVMKAKDEVIEYLQRELDAHRTVDT